MASMVPIQESNSQIQSRALLSTQRSSDESMETSSDLASATDSDEQIPPESAGPAEEDEADQVFGLNMSQAHSRIRSRQTPAEEKSRLMEQAGGFFEPIPDMDGEGAGTQQEVVMTPPRPPPPSTRPGQANEGSKQTTGTAGEKTTARTGFTRRILRDGFKPRPRSWSDATSTSKLRKIFSDLSLPSTRSSRSRSSSSSRVRDSSRQRASTSISRPRGESDTTEFRPASATPPTVAPTVEETAPRLPSRPGLSTSGSALRLRRSRSDQSLYLRNIPSITSLEQRPRYENVHSQVNSRFKAIKDTILDSGNRLMSRAPLTFTDIKDEANPRSFREDFHRRLRDRESHAKTAIDGEQRARHDSQATTREDTLYPVLSQAISELSGDVVVMGGYRGSVLRSAHPPYRQLWVPLKVGLNIRRVNLELGLDPEDEERAEETVIPSGSLTKIGPVDIWRRLQRRFESHENVRNGNVRIWNYGYDWRLSPRLLARKFKEFLEGLPCNAPDVPREKRGAWVIAHSLGGLLARHVVNERPDLFAGVLYAGTPQRCVNILGPIRHGDDVLISSRVLPAQVNFSFRTSFVFLPEDGFCFLNKHTGEPYPVDFYSAKNWVEYRLSPCVGTPVPVPNKKKGLKHPLRVGKRISTIMGGNFGNPNTDAEVGPAPDEGPVDIDVEGDDGDNGVEDPRRSPHVKPPAHQDSLTNSNSSSSSMKRSLDGTKRRQDAAAAAATTNTPNINNPLKKPRVTTIPRDKAIAYLERVLPETASFRRELAFNPSHQSENLYPPFAVLYGKSVPTVYGARVESREHIKRTDAYDDLAFAAGDGVVLASAAMIPSGYRVINGGLVRTERGHVGLLGDLEGVGQCLRALVRGRREGRVGLGK